MTRDEKSPPSESTEPSFEQAFTRLEQVVQQLEDGQLGLSESLTCYEEGVKCLRQCHDALRLAERRIMLLTGVDPDGNPVTKPFEDEELTLEEKQGSRGRRRSHAATERRGTARDDPATKGGADVDNPRGLF